MQQKSKFRAGDRVVDRDADTVDNEMIVLNPNVGPANDVEVDGLNATVAELNETYPPRDPVVSVVFVSWLDSYVTGWREWDKRLFARTLNEYADDWSIPLKTYSYPESRLERSMSRCSGSEGGGSGPTINSNVESPTQKSNTEPKSSTISTMTPTRQSLSSLSSVGIAVAAAQR